MKTSKLTYFNQLKQYINTLNTVQEVRNIEYGQALTGKFLDTYNDIIQKTQEQNSLVLSNLVKTKEPDNEDSSVEADENGSFGEHEEVITNEAG